MKHSVIKTFVVAFFASISLYASGQVTVTSQANYLFKSDTTYYVPNAVTLTGTTTFEGGTVIKYAANASLTVSAVNCIASPYHPVIFTAKDDNTVGSQIAGSTGNPNYYGYANPALNFSIGVGVSCTMTNFRIAYAQQGIVTASANVTLYHGQFVNCGAGISAGNGVVLLRNLLFANVNLALNNVAYLNLDAQQVTFSGAPSTPVSSYVVSSGGQGLPFGLFFKNCVFDRMAGIVAGGIQPPYQTLGGEVNGFTLSCATGIAFGSTQVSSSGAPFQSAGAGSYYLAGSPVSGDSSGLRAVGAADLDPGLIEDLQTKTTYAPVTTPPAAGTTWPQTAIRESGNSCSSYDLGYHYDPLDYLCSQVAANTGTTILAPGVAIGFYGVSGFVITSGAEVASDGEAGTNMNHLAWYPAVQEQSLALSGVNTGTSSMFDLNQQSGVAKYVALNFADLSGLGRRQNLFAANLNFPFPVVLLNNCQLTAATLTVGQGANFNFPSGSACVLENNLLQRCSVSFYNGATQVYNPNGPPFFYQNPLSVFLYNNLFWSNSVSFTYLGAMESPKTTWTINDNLFDGTALSFYVDGSYPGYITTTHNAYFHTTSGQMAGQSDVTLTNLIYANAILGNRYIRLAQSSASSTALYGAGSRSTASAGLTGFTQSTNQAPDPAQVNIGFHYEIAFKPLIIGLKAGGPSSPSSIVTFDYTTGNLLSTFVPDAVVQSSAANGRGLAINGSQIFYTVLSGGFGPSDGIHVAPYGVYGSGGHDIHVLPNPRSPASGIQDLAFHNNELFVLTGYDSDPLEVFELDPTTGNVLAGPINVVGNAASGSDGFVVLPDGDLLINRGDASPIYDEYEFDGIEYVFTGASIDLTALGLPIFAATGVALAPDGKSLFFSANVHQTGTSMFVQTDLEGNLISSRPICTPSDIEDIDVVF